MEENVNFDELHELLYEPNIDSTARELFRVIHGRRYHNVKNAKYVLPLDSRELDRMIYHHYMLKFAFQQNFFADIKDKLVEGAKCLDIGCGPGAWVCEMATDYPNSKFFGIDIVPNFPESVMPENVKFLAANILTGLPFKDGEFDYIHMRHMVLGLEKNDWEDLVINELIRLVKPGGWIELMEPYTIGHQAGSAFREFNNKFLEWLKASNIDYKIIDEIETILKNTNQFHKITRQVLKIPIGKWGGLVGQFCEESLLEFMHTEYETIGDTLDMDVEQFETLVKKSAKEMDDDKLECCAYYHSFLAQKG
ncbi:hypothetical protein G9A89_005675 [Geosiphon pyriformis]|nr:hypothetical protein G9A89_005675 [Geosiphon pyriformis]